MTIWLDAFPFWHVIKKIYLDKGFNTSIWPIIVSLYLLLIFHFRPNLRLNSDCNFTEPPLNLTVETMPFGYEYYGNIDETINCTAAMNPNNTVNVPDWKKVSVTEWIFLRKDKKCTNNRGIKKQHRLLSDRTNCFLRTW